ncbi:hypothetical protein EHM76_00925 [bacterium]|nr:MAG: hypothetical protein EHM76_00925 [bacterium]
MSDSHILAAALAYARLGWPVFPVGLDKSPVTAHGFQDATTHEGLIRDWWETRYPDANVALGIPQGLVVLDFDPRNGAPEPEVFKWGTSFPMRAETPSGGTHLYFKVDPDLELRGKMMQGIDVKAGGKGYVLLPPSRREDGKGYLWYNCDPTLDEELFLTELPEWVLGLITRPETTFEVSGEHSETSSPTFPWEVGTPYGEYGLQQQIGFLSMAQNGERNQRLNSVGFRVGQLVAGGELKEEALFHVARVAEWLGLEREEIGQTLRSSYDAGTRKPWKR